MARSIITIPVAGTTLFDRTAPVITPSVTTLTTVTPGNQQNGLIWFAETGATSYKVYYATSPGVTTSSSYINVGNVTNYTHTGLVNGTTYYYAIQVIGSGGAASGLSNELSGTPIVPSITDTYSILFDGLTNYGQIPAVSNTNLVKGKNDPFTFSIWLKLSSTSGTQFVIDGNNDAYSYGWSIYISSGQPTFYMFAAGGGSYVTVQMATALSTGTWYHLAVTKTSSALASGINIYINGSAMAKTVLHDNLAGDTTGNNRFRMANSNPGSQYLSGKLDEGSMWNIAMTSANVLALYNSGTPSNLTLHPNAANLTDWWRFGDASGDTSILIKDVVDTANMSLINSPSYSTDVP